MQCLQPCGDDHGCSASNALTGHTRHTPKSVHEKYTPDSEECVRAVSYCMDAAAPYARRTYGGDVDDALPHDGAQHACDSRRRWCRLWDLPRQDPPWHGRWYVPGHSDGESSASVGPPASLRFSECWNPPPVLLRMLLKLLARGSRGRWDCHIATERQLAGRLLRAMPRRLPRRVLGMGLRPFRQSQLRYHGEERTPQAGREPRYRHQRRRPASTPAPDCGWTVQR